MYNPNVYGYVNGKPVGSRDEFIYESRRRGPIETDEELIAFAEKVSGKWSQAGNGRSFIGYYLGDYALDEPYRSLTKKEYERLKELQEMAQEEYRKMYVAPENEKGGRIYTREIIARIFQRDVDRKMDQFGENDYWTKMEQKAMETKLTEYDAGKVVLVETEAFVENCTSYEREFYSDGTVRVACYGYDD